VLGHSALAFSPDGTRLAAGAPGEQSAATGINGDQSDNSAPWSGAVYLFDQVNSTHWNQTAYIKAADTRADNQFGYSVALSSNSLVAGALGWTNDPPPGIIGGSAYVFGTSPLAQTDDVVSPMPSHLGQFGRTVAIRADGTAIAVGAPFEEQSTGTVYVLTP
jgi:hypothetical protein